MNVKLYEILSFVKLYEICNDLLFYIKQCVMARKMIFSSRQIDMQPINIYKKNNMFIYIERELCYG
jgi:hypothetical protein